MSLNIKSEEAERLARELAGATGETLTGAVTEALRERLSRVEGKEQAEIAARSRRMQAISADAATRWIEPLRSADHADLLYDDQGLPT